MTISQARKLLGPSHAKWSDSEVDDLIKAANLLKELFFNIIIYKKGEL